MTQVAFLSTGEMGSRMVARLLKAGHQVAVWNRTVERTRPLAEAGARVAETPRLAVQGAEIVFSMTRDDDASRSIWLDSHTGALAAMGDGAIGVECSTLSVQHVRDLARTFEKKGRAFLDAPVAGSRPQADAGQLIFFVGGPSHVLERVQPLLTIMGGAVQHAGEHGAGATVKLMINVLFGAQLAALAELIGFAMKSGIDAAKAIEIIGNTPVCSPAAKLASGAMLAGAFEPAFPIELVAKDFALAAHSAAEVAADLPVAAAVRIVYENGVEAGLGGDNITGIVQLYHKEE